MPLVRSRAHLSPPATPTLARSPTPDVPILPSGTSYTSNTPRARSNSFSDATPKPHLKVLPAERIESEKSAGGGFGSAFGRPEFLKRGQSGGESSGSNRAASPVGGVAVRALGLGGRSQSAKAAVQTATLPLGSRPNPRPLGSVSGASGGAGGQPIASTSSSSGGGTGGGISSAVPAPPPMSAYDARVMALVMDRATVGGSSAGGSNAGGGGGGVGGGGSIWEGHSGVGEAVGSGSASIYAGSSITVRGGGTGDTWSVVVLRVIPLFNGETPKTHLEDLSDLFATHLRLTLSSSPSRAFQRLSQDIIELLSNGMITLSSKLSPDQLADIPLLIRLEQVWTFFFRGVLPYVEAVFLPLLTEPGWLALESKGKSKAAIQAADPDEASIDIRRLALMAFRDHLICPLFPRLERVFGELYGTPGSTRTSRTPSTDWAAPTSTPRPNPSGTSDSLHPPPNLPSRPVSPLTPPPLTSYHSNSSSGSSTQTNPMITLQMISLLASVLTNDDRQMAMEELGRRIAAYTTGGHGLLQPGNRPARNSRQEGEKRRGWVGNGFARRSVRRPNGRNGNVLGGRNGNVDGMNVDGGGYGGQDGGGYEACRLCKGVMLL